MASDGPSNGDSGNWSQIDAAFQAALEQPAKQRVSWVKQKYSDDQQTRDAVLSFLADEKPSAALFESACNERDRIASAVLEEDSVERVGKLVGSMIGPYRLEQLLATGGMGAVYRAERADRQFEQTVAIKILPGWATDAQTVARLKAERQILAALQHPGITKLLDGGETPDGFPYLVTEFIDGLPITEFSKQSLPDINQRLELFARVADAVHYAHQKQVIHRDIKPANILVDKAGRPHLLDFGIAKLLEAGAHEMTFLQTATGFTPMTPEYASPEQKLGKEVTSASDVYQLGLLLFHLLTGIRASKQTTIRGAGATRPSTAVLSQQQLEQLSSEIDPARLARQLKGDLDTIVLKALREEPLERYASAAEMAADVRRHMQGEAIQARPETLWSATKRLSSHYPFAAVLSASLAALLVIWATSMFFYARELEVQRDEATRHAMRATHVKNVLIDIFRRSDPLQADTIGGKTASVWDSLDAATAETREQLSAEPDIQAELFTTLAGLYGYSGEADKARDLLLEALQLYQSSGSGFDVEIAVTQAEYAAYLGSDNYNQARPLMQQSIRQATRFSETNPEAHVSILLDAGNLENGAGNYEAALAYLQRAEEILKRYKTVDAPLQIEVISTKADVLISLGRLGESESLLLLALNLGESHFGSNHRRLVTTLSSLGQLYRRLAKFEQSIAYSQQVIDLIEQDSGSTYDSLLSAKNNLAVSFGAAGHYHKEQQILREIISTQRTISGSEASAELAIHLKNLSSSLHLTGDYEAALETLSEASVMIKKYFPPNSFHQALPYFTRALIYLDTERSELAEAEALATLARLEPILGNDHFHIHVTRCVIAEAYLGQGKLDESRALAEPAMQGMLASSTKTQTYIDRCRDTLNALETD